LFAALEPVADRLLRRHKSLREALRIAREKQDQTAMKAVEDELASLTMFKGDLGAYLRLYTFLSQIFDYGNTDIEKRAIFFKRLLPLLEFGREREGVDLSKVILTRHKLSNKGRQPLPLTEGENPKLEPMTESGSGSVREAERVYMAELIEKLNDLFGGETTEQDQLVYVNSVIKGKLLESETLMQQAANNTKEQFASSPDIDRELGNAIIEALDAHNAMSTKALNSDTVRRGIKDILLNYSRLWEALRSRAGNGDVPQR
jgi:type I restriction enzyme R subunit